MKRSSDVHLEDSKRCKLDPLTEDSDDFEAGKGFHSYAEIEEAIQNFEKRNFVQVYKRSSRGLTAYAKKCPKKKLNPELLFSEIDFACLPGGKNFKSSSKGHRPNQQ